MFNKINLIFILSLFIFISCEGEALFDNLEKSRLKVIIKGTYASNDPRPWNIPGDTDIDSDYTDDSCKFLTPGDGYPSDYTNSFPSMFMIDIAEIRAEGDKFAYYRNLFYTPLTDTEPFFSGEGVEYENDDLYTDTNYTNIELYVRKMIFDNVNVYSKNSDGDWYRESNSEFEVVFDEEDVQGFDFNPRQSLTFYDFLKDNYGDINRVFPLSLPIVGGLITNAEDEYVIEIRIMVKNYVRKYEYVDDTDDDEVKYFHYYAFSDWLWDVQSDDYYRGGNVIGVARAYEPSKTATITGSTTSGSYVVAIPTTEDIQRYIFPSSRMRPSSEYIDQYFLNDPAIYDNGRNRNMDDVLSYLVDERKRDEDEYNTMLHYSSILDYESTWDSYNETLNYVDSDGDVVKRILPPLATWNSSGTYTITNVPDGIYDVYRVDAPSYGEMPIIDTGASYQLGQVTIDSSNYGTSVSPL